MYLLNQINPGFFFSKIFIYGCPRGLLILLFVKQSDKPWEVMIDGSEESPTSANICTKELSFLYSFSNHRSRSARCLGSFL